MRMCVNECKGVCACKGVETAQGDAGGTFKQGGALGQRDKAVGRGKGRTCNSRGQSRATAVPLAHSGPTVPGAGPRSERGPSQDRKGPGTKWVQQHHTESDVYAGGSQRAGASYGMTSEGVFSWGSSEGF